MFGYKHGYSTLDLNYIFSYQKDIFGIFIKEEINTHDKYLAPYREDKTPGCYFVYDDDGVLYFHDWATFKSGINCVELVKVCLNLSFEESLSYIESFILDNKLISNNPIVKYKNQEIQKVKRDIFISIRNWNKLDAKFWSSYQINREQLKEDKVYPIYAYSSFKKDTLEPFTVNTKQSYAYTDFKDNKKKIYSPYDKEHKWFTNCSQNDIGGRFENKGMLIITKSYKDYRVLKNQGLNVCWFQNEGQVPNRLILEELIKQKYKILVWFDNDTTGIGASNLVKDIINDIKPNLACSIVLDPKLLNEGIKDPSDLLKKKGKKELEIFINKNILQWNK